MASFPGFPNLRNPFSALSHINDGTVSLRSSPEQVIGLVTDEPLNRDEGKQGQQESSSGYSRILTENKSYDWTIENILSFRPEITTNEHPAPESSIDIKSPTFYVPGNPSTKWHMYMRFGGKAGTNRPTSHASIWLVLEKPSEPVKANFEIKILNDHGQIQHVQRSGFRSFDANDTKSNPWGFDNFIPYTAFQNPESSIFVRNKLRIRLGLRLFLGTVNLPLPQKRVHDAVQRFTNAAAGDSLQACSYLSTSRSASSQQEMNDMRTAISSLWKNDNFTDVKIVTGDKIFSAHKVILAARSSVFSTMFGSQSFLESQNHEVKMDVFSPEVVEAMIQFIYTDRADILGDIEKASELLEVAEMYALTSLKYDCFVELINRMDIENASKIAVIAYYYKPTPEIMALIKDFFKCNLIDIKETSGFNDMFVKHHNAFSSIMRYSQGSIID